MTTLVFPSASGGATVVSALAAAARQCGVRTPTSWITTTNRDAVEMREDFLVDAVEDILDRVDLPSPIGAETTITGTGAETYALPGDYRRLQRDTNAIYDKDQDRPGVPIVNDGDYTAIKDLGTAGVVKYFRVRGFTGNFEIDIYMPPGTGSEIVVHYMTGYWCASSAGVVQDSFLAETDILLLPRKLVTAGIVWRFRERRGLPYEDKFAEFEALLSRASNDRRVRRSINFGEADRSVRWQDLVPSFIPDS